MFAGGLDTTTYVIPVVLVFVAIVSTTALVFSCFTFYRWRRLAITLTDKQYINAYNRRNCADLFYKKPCSLYTGCGLMGWPSLNGSDTSSFSEVVLNTLPDRGFICRGQSQYSVSVTRILYYFKKLFVSWHVLW